MSRQESASQDLMTFLSLLSHREPLLSCYCQNWAQDPPILMGFNAFYLFFFLLINTVNEHIRLQGGWLLGKVVAHNTATGRSQRDVYFGEY